VLNSRRLSGTGRWIVAALLLCTAPIQAETTPETRLKAAILSKFPQFIEWPQTALDGRTTIDICVAPPDPFGSDLQDLLSGEQLNGRALAMRRLNNASEVGTCHVLFVPARATARRSILAAAARLPVLTVSDDPGFLESGGIVCLRVVDGRVRFEIDDGAARRAGLRISSQLLRLAIAVRGGTA
jgi:hypothetical protein